MELDRHVLVTGKQGRLAGVSPREAGELLDAALAHERVVLHVHGGLVDECGGRRTAQSLAPVYADAGAFPVFLVWRSGLLEVLRRNLLEIAREEIFERLLRLVLAWTVGKARQAEEGGRSAAPSLPQSTELDGELAGRLRESDPEAGHEPFVGEQVPEQADLVLTPAEEQRFLVQAAGDGALGRQLTGLVAALGSPGETLAPRGGLTAPAVPTHMDADVVAELAGGSAEGGRGVVSTTILAKKALEVLRAVLARHRQGTDSGLYPTVVEELLRAFYFGHAGGAVWHAMKQETLDTVDRDSRDRAGAILLDRLSVPRARAPRVTLVGHSTGALFLDNLMTAVARQGGEGSGFGATFSGPQVVHLAPACTTEHFALTLDVAEHLIGRFRLFTMTDAAERSDRLLGAVYPRSLLYLVSNLLERDRDRSAVVPVLGLSRYLDRGVPVQMLESEFGRSARLDRVRGYIGEEGRVVLSPTTDDALPGARASAVRHGDFDDDSLVRESLGCLIGGW